MKTLKKIILFAAYFTPLLWRGAGGEVSAQCQPMIVIDGNNIVADETSTNGLKLPSWLKSTQTLNVGQFVYSVSVIEFSVNGSALDYSQNLSITTSSTVPSGKVWKIESINKNSTLPSFSGTYTYSTAGTYTFIAPPCVSTARIQIWGAGGGGAGASSSCGFNSGGGGGGGYAEGFYQLASGASYTITVGAGGTGTGNGNGGNGNPSSVSVIGINVPGASGGVTQGAGGVGSTGVGQLNFKGSTGNSGAGWGGGVKGGDAANGGGAGAPAAGSWGAAGGTGTSPGGGGGGGGSDDYGSCTYYGGGGGAGAPGKVVITFGVSTASNKPCVVMKLRRYSGGGAPANCPSGWTEVDYQNVYDGPSSNNERTCMKCD